MDIVRCIVGHVRTSGSAHVWVVRTSTCAHSRVCRRLAATIHRDGDRSADRPLLPAPPGAARRRGVIRSVPRPRTRENPHVISRNPRFILLDTRAISRRPVARLCRHRARMGEGRVPSHEARAPMRSPRVSSRNAPVSRQRGAGISHRRGGSLRREPETMGRSGAIYEPDRRLQRASALRRGEHRMCLMCTHSGLRSRLLLARAMPAAPSWNSAVRLW
jgi:hypothetical protein